MDTPPPFRQHTTRRRRIVALFTERLALKGTAVLIAIVLWFVVNAKEPQLEVVPVRFTPVLDSSLALRDPLPELHALVAGSPKELIKLTADEPEIRRQITSDAPDTVVIDLRPDDVKLPDGVDAVVRDVQPRSLTLRFETTWTRKASVRSAIQVANDMGTPLTTRFDPESVQVTGPRRLVLRIPSVRTVKTIIAFPDSLPHLVDIDTTGFGSGVRVRPTQVKVLITPVPNG